MINEGAAMPGETTNLFFSNLDGRVAPFLIMAKERIV